MGYGTTNFGIGSTSMAAVLVLFILLVIITMTFVI
nr:YjcZ family sporulation protein [Paenibacillus aestuarii]